MTDKGRLGDTFGLKVSVCVSTLSAMANESIEQLSALVEQLREDYRDLAQRVQKIEEERSSEKRQATFDELQRRSYER